VPGAIKQKPRVRRNVEWRVGQAKVFQIHALLVALRVPLGRCRRLFTSARQRMSQLGAVAGLLQTTNKQRTRQTLPILKGPPPKLQA
jgi:hypothetical protein